MFGVKIYQPNGSIWMAPEFTPMNLISKGVIPGAQGAVFQSGIPDGAQSLFFVRFQYDGTASFSEVIQNGMRSLMVQRVQGTGDIYVYSFGLMVTPAPKYGFFIFNESGAMVYHSGMRPLEVHQVELGFSDGQNYQNVGGNCAVLPTLMGRISQPNSQVGGYNQFNYYTGAYGSTVTNKRIQIAIGSGPSGFNYLNSASYILTDKY